MSDTPPSRRPLHQSVSGRPRLRKPSLGQPSLRQLLHFHYRHHYLSTIYACIKATLCQSTTALNRPNARHRTRLSRLSSTNKQEAVPFVTANTLVIMLLFRISDKSIESRRLLIATKTLRCQVQATSTVGTPIFSSLLAPSRSVNDSSSP